MKKMHNIKELVKKLCPNGVEYKELNTLVDYIQPTKYIVKSTKYNDEYDIPVLTPGQTFILGYTNEADGIYKASKEKPAILFDDFTTAFRWIDFEFKVKSSAVKILVLKSNENNFKYIYYAMQCISYIPSQHARHWISTYSKILIPVPPIEVQNEIVRILDNFTELEAELKAELEVRKKQYEYYRNTLLNFENAETLAAVHTHTHTHGYFKEQIKFIRFGEVAEIVRGSSPRPISSFITNDDKGINWIKIGDVDPTEKYITSAKQKITIDGAKKSRIVKKGDFILSNSMSFGRPYILKIDGCIHDGWLSISKFEKIYNTDFLYYLLSSDYVQKQMRQKASIGTVQNLNADIVKSIKLPVYSMEYQHYVVNILNIFDKLINDIKQGLPAEIEARRKQYEYYRNKLLKFKELKVENEE